MFKKFLVLGVLAAATGAASASDLRHLRFAPTPSEAAQPGPAGSVRDREAPYALTGRRSAKAARPAPTNLPNHNVESPHFRPGK